MANTAAIFDIKTEQFKRLESEATCHSNESTKFDLQFRRCCLKNFKIVNMAAILEIFECT